jgi:hypothetical protein
MTLVSCLYAGIGSRRELGFAACSQLLQPSPQEYGMRAAKAHSKVGGALGQRLVLVPGLWKRNGEGHIPQAPSNNRYPVLIAL